MEFGIPELKLTGEGTVLHYAVEEILSKERVDIEYEEQNQSTLLFVGNNSVGKTSLIYKFCGLSEPVEPTFILDYFPSPRTFISLNNENVQCHIWELASGTLYEQSLLYLSSSPSLTVVICMDLSKPNFLYYTQSEILDMILKFIKARSDFEHVHKTRVAAIPKEHPDAGFLKPFPVPLIVIGCMYDVFYKFEPEKKRLITQFMRYVAHLYGAYLIYWTDRNNEIMKQAKDILKHYTHEAEMPSSKKTDYNKAVFVPPYSDRFDDIEPNVPVNMQSIEKYESLLEAYFPQEKISKFDSGENPADNPEYADPAIDLVRKQLLQKEVFGKWNLKPQVQEIDDFNMENPFADIKPVEFRKFASDENN